MTSPEKLTETHESDLDREFKISVFDYMIDQVLAGSITMDECVEAFQEVIQDMKLQDG